MLAFVACDWQLMSVTSRVTNEIREVLCRVRITRQNQSGMLLTKLGTQFKIQSLHLSAVYQFSRKENETASRALVAIIAREQKTKYSTSQSPLVQRR